MYAKQTPSNILSIHSIKIVNKKRKEFLWWSSSEEESCKLIFMRRINYIKEIFS